MTEFENNIAALPTPPSKTDDTDSSDAESITDGDRSENPTQTEQTEQTAQAEQTEQAERAEQISNPKKRSADVFFKKSAVYLLIGVSSVFFTVSAAALITGIPDGADLLTRAMLGEFLGGIDNIRAVSSYDAEYYPITEKPENIAGESASDPLTSVQMPTEHYSFVNDTLDTANETPYDIDMNEILAMERAIPAADELYEIHGDGAPLVLILHTHATEGFADSADSSYRTSDTAKNAVSLGKIIADKLNENGIVTLHSTTLFDSDDFTMAYYNASLEIRRTLEEYPSISYIIDIHRDSIESDGVYIAPSVEASDGTAAQMMFVIGTDYGGSGHTTWKNNLSLAARLQSDLNESTPGLMRSINIRSASFNEQYSDGSLLVEIGSCASEPEEVRRSAEKLADALVREILGQ